MNYIKKAGVMMMGVLMTAIMAGCGTVETGFSRDGRIPVVASFEATKKITEAIKEYFEKGIIPEALTVIPEGTEPHEFELKSGDIQKLQEARLFVYNGLGMEPWADQAIQAADNSKLKTVNGIILSNMRKTHLLVVMLLFMIQMLLFHSNTIWKMM